MDCKGVLGFPMRLALAVILVSLCAPSLAHMAESYQDDAEADDVETQVDRIACASGRVYYSGNGSSETVSVDIPAGFEVKIGGEGADRYTISILEDCRTVSTRYMEHPSVCFLGDAVVLSGPCDVTVSCTCSDGVYGIEAVCT